MTPLAPIAIGGRGVNAAIEELAERDQWCVWRANGRPYTPGGTPCAVTRQFYRSSFNECWQAAYADGTAGGLSFILLPRDPFLGLDLDDVIGEDGALEPKARALVDALNTYTEISPSGRGLRIFCKVHQPPEPGGRGRKAGCVEGAWQGKALRMTGNHLPGTPEEIRWIPQDRINQLWRQLFPERPAGSVEDDGSTEWPDWERVTSARSYDQLPEPLRARFEAALAKDTKLRARWGGSTEGMSDTSGSARDFSLARALHRHGFTLDEYASLAWVWEHGKAEADARHYARCWAKTAPDSSSAAAGGPKARLIDVVPGQLAALVRTAHAILAEGSPELFRYGGELAHVERIEKEITWKDGRFVPVGTMELIPAAREWIQLQLCRLARWQRLNSRGETVGCDPPMKIATGVLADRANSKQRILTGLTEIPILRQDGQVRAKPGYDPQTALYYAPNGATFPSIAPQLIRANAVRSLETLAEPLKDFPFVKEHHRSAALAMILTGVIRRQLVRAPAFGVSAREAGTGKGLLVDVAAMIITGRASPITPFTADPDEQRKRITSSLLAGASIINIDNVDAPVEGAALSALLTSEVWKERILGASREAEVPANVLVLMTGNNLTVMGDMTRRVLMIEMDAQCERPELRTFERELLPWVQENRPRLVAAALTALAAWRQAGRRLHAGFRPLGSYEQWSREIAGCLVWADLPDPIRAMDAIRANDPRRDLLRRITGSWFDTFGDDAKTIGQVLDHLQKHAGEDYAREALSVLYEAIVEATPDAKTEHARRVRFGLYLGAVAGKVVTVENRDLRFVKRTPHARAVTWCVEDLTHPIRAAQK